MKKYYSQMKKYYSQRYCPKCGNEFVTDKYTNKGFEAIQRTCDRCGYVWHERVLETNNKEVDNA